MMSHKEYPYCSHAIQDCGIEVVVIDDRLQFAGNRDSPRLGDAMTRFSSSGNLPPPLSFRTSPQERNRCLSVEDVMCISRFAVAASSRNTWPQPSNLVAMLILRTALTNCDDSDEESVLRRDGKSTLRQLTWSQDALLPQHVWQQSACWT